MRNARAVATTPQTTNGLFEYCTLLFYTRRANAKESIICSINCRATFAGMSPDRLMTHDLSLDRDSLPLSKIFDVAEIYW